MVERIMLFKLRDAAARDELAASARAVLSLLPGIDACSVGIPADAASEKSWDLSVVLGFRSAAQLESALRSAIYTRFVETTLGAHVTVHKGWTFARLA